MGHPFLIISLIFASICLWIFGGQSSAAYPFSFAAKFDLSSSSSGKFPINWRRNGLRFSSNFCILKSNQPRWIWVVCIKVIKQPLFSPSRAQSSFIPYQILIYGLLCYYLFFHSSKELHFKRRSKTSEIWVRTKKVLQYKDLTPKCPVKDWGEEEKDIELYLMFRLGRIKRSQR